VAILVIGGLQAPGERNRCHQAATAFGIFITQRLLMAGSPPWAAPLDDYTSGGLAPKATGCSTCSPPNGESKAVIETLSHCRRSERTLDSAQVSFGYGGQAKD